MSRKRGKKHKAAVPAVPEDILAEGSGPVREVAADAIATVEDVVTTEDIATTEDVVTADDVVATAEERPAQRRAVPAADTADAIEPAPEEPPAGDVAGDLIAGDVSDAAELDVAAGASPPDDADAEADPIDDDSAGAGPAEAGAESGGEGDGDDDDIGIVFPTSAATMDAVQLKHLVEALIFAADRPLTVQRLRQLTRVGDVRRLEQALVELAEDYRERGLILQQVSGGYQFRTRTQFSAWVQQLIAGRPVRLSRAQLETLAIIAYRQPITRPEIDDIRGVDSSATLKLLIDRMLIRVLGKREEVGRPMLYGTTKEFLDFFSLGDLRELPTLREYSELTAESRKVMSDRLGIAPDGSDGNGGGSGGEGDGSGGEGDGNGSSGPTGGGGGDGGMIPGFDDDGAISDGGGAPANASATDLADAVATFLSAADAVDRSSAAAVADPEDRELSDELAGDDAGDDPAHDDAEAAQIDGEAVFVVAEAAYAAYDDAEAVQVDDGSGDAMVAAAPGSSDDQLVADARDHGAAYADHEAEAIEAPAVEAVEAPAVEAVEAAPVEAAAVEAAAVETAAVETAAVEVEAVETAAVEVEAVETAAVEVEAVETAAVEVEAVNAVEVGAVEVEAVEAVLPPVTSSDEGAWSLVETLLDATASLHESVSFAADGQVDDDGRVDGDGQVDGDAGWPAGSQRFSVIAPIDDRPVERPVMDSNVIGAGVLDDGDGDAAATAASHVEPAAE